MSKKDKSKATAPIQDTEFKVNIFTINEGLITYDNVKYIRIKSTNYNLLIMKDYFLKRLKHGNMALLFQKYMMNIAQTVEMLLKLKWEE